MGFVYAVAGLLAGIAIGYLASRTKSAGEVSELKTKLDMANQESLRTAELLEEAQATFKAEFENLANRIFDEKTTKFASQSKENIGAVLTPLREQLDAFRKRIDQVYVDEAEKRAALLTEIQGLKALNQQLSEDASNLTKALRSDTKKQGNWGELVLQRVLELSGLEEGREYETQVHLHEKHAGVQSRYPDVVVRLPEGRDVIIDSKVSLKAYMDFCGTEDEEERAGFIKAHIQSVKNHINELSDKKYEELDGINTIDTVIMCVPSEPAFIAAVSEDGSLYEEAFKKNVLIAGPSTLMVTLRIIASIWRREDQVNNALEIADRGAKLYDKFVGFVEDLEDVSKAIANAQKACESASGKLSEGSGNLVGQAEKLRKLGVKSRKRLPQSMVEGATGVIDLGPAPETASRRGASEPKELEE